MQTPSLGRIVLVKVNPASNNGSDTAHAAITRVWGQGDDGNWTINVRVTLDASLVADPWLTSVRLFDTEEQAVANGPSSAYWPPRV